MSTLVKSGNTFSCIRNYLLREAALERFSSLDICWSQKLHFSICRILLDIALHQKPDDQAYNTVHDQRCKRSNAILPKGNAGTDRDPQRQSHSSIEHPNSGAAVRTLPIRVLFTEDQCVKAANKIDSTGGNARDRIKVADPTANA